MLHQLPFYLFNSYFPYGNEKNINRTIIKNVLIRSIHEKVLNFKSKLKEEKMQNVISIKLAILESFSKIIHMFFRQNIIIRKVFLIDLLGQRLYLFLLEDHVFS